MEGEWGALARELGALLRRREGLEQQLRALEARQGRVEHRLAQMHAAEDVALQVARERSERGEGSWDSGVGHIEPVDRLVPPFMPSVSVAPGYAGAPAVVEEEIIRCPGGCEWAGVEHTHLSTGDVIGGVQPG